jgi:ferredoxin
MSYARESISEHFGRCPSAARERICALLCRGCGACGASCDAEAYGFRDLVFFKLKIMALHQSKSLLSDEREKIQGVSDASDLGIMTMLSPFQKAPEFATFATFATSSLI